MKHIAEEWQQFKALVLIPSGVTALQESEMQKAFYAGAQSLLSKLCRLFEATGSEEPTEADSQVMSDVTLELKEFFANMQGVKAGHA
jgi:hypothetical protein